LEGAAFRLQASNSLSNVDVTEAWSMLTSLAGHGTVEFTYCCVVTLWTAPLTEVMASTKNVEFLIV